MPESRATSTPLRRPVRGTDPWYEVGGRVRSHWDVWLALVCVLGGEWDWLDAAPEDRGVTWQRDTEAKRSHVDDLVGRLTDANCRPEELVALASDGRRELKARTEVMRQAAIPRDVYADPVDGPADA